MCNLNLFPVNALYIPYEPSIPKGIPIKRDFVPYIILSNLIILLNLLKTFQQILALQIPLLLSTYLFVNKYICYTTNVITVINPYKNIFTTSNISLFLVSYIP